MSISSVSSLLASITNPQQPQSAVTQSVAAKNPATQATSSQPVAADSDGDNDGSGGASITPPVNIKA